MDKIWNEFVPNILFTFVFKYEIVLSILHSLAQTKKFKNFRRYDNSNDSQNSSQFSIFHRQIIV